MSSNTAHRYRRYALALATWLLAGPAHAFLLGQLDGVADAGLRRCAERHARLEGMRQHLALDVVDRNGAHSRSAATLAWRRFDDGQVRILVRMSEPPARAGVGLLMIESAAQPQLYLYLPELRRTRRITGQALAGSMLGTDFSYEDFAALQGLVGQATVRRLADATLGGRTTWRFAITGDGDTTAYREVVTWLEPKSCMPLRMEFFGGAEAPVKVLEIDAGSIAGNGAIELPRRAVMYDRRQGSHTVLVVEDVLPTPPAAHEFDLSALQRTP